MSTDWEKRAACANEDPHLWFVDNRQLEAEALAICAGCPVKRDCLATALERGEKFGIWGGRRFGSAEREDYALPKPWKIVERKRRTA